MEHCLETKHLQMAKLMRTLGHPVRLAMVEALGSRAWCVCELARHLGLNKSAASKHLSALKTVGIIDMVRQGTQVCCTLVMPCVFDMMFCAIHHVGTDGVGHIGGCRSPLKDRKRVMFVCVHNSARSQMCEAFVRRFASDRFVVHSSGIEAGVLNPLVVRAMAEIGISMEGHHAKLAQDFIDRNESFDYVITVCDESNAERCPVFPGKHVRVHWSFPDPSSLQGTDDEKLASIRHIRDDIRNTIETWLAAEP